MADAHGSGPCVRKDVGVQLPPRAHFSGTSPWHQKMSRKPVEVTGPALVLSVLRTVRRRFLRHPPGPAEGGQTIRASTPSATSAGPGTSPPASTHRSSWQQPRRPCCAGRSGRSATAPRVGAIVALDAPHRASGGKPAPAPAERHRRARASARPPGRRRRAAVRASARPPRGRNSAKDQQECGAGCRRQDHRGKWSTRAGPAASDSPGNLGELCQLGRLEHREGRQELEQQQLAGQ